MRTGSLLPAACTVGEFFFLLSAPAGQNVQTCAAINIWTAQGTAITTKASGVVVGTRAVYNFDAGFGSLQALSDTGTEILLQLGLDSAVVETHARLQTGETLRCLSAGGLSAAYQCSLNPALESYLAGMVLYWTPDMTNGGALTLDVDTLGAKPVLLADGVTNAAPGDVVAGRMYPLWYDGTLFRLITVGVDTVRNGTAQQRPVCTLQYAGRIWHTVAAAGTKDEVAVCAKDSNDSYGWRLIY